MLYVDAKVALCASLCLCDFVAISIVEPWLKIKL
jgi:hypothetical protein